MLNLCTYFDINYLHRGVALYHSIEKTGEPFTLWILCFDEQTYEIMNKLALPHAEIISEQEFEKGDDALINAKLTRTRVEYYWTSTASLPLYIFRKNKSIDLLIYLDADIFFYASPALVVAELGDNSILIVPHDYSPEYEAHLEAGIYNVGIMAFRRNTDGMACLNWWRERCIEWCYSTYENGQIGDQAYLNEFPGKFGGVKVSGNIGINAAPWNVAKYGLKKNHEKLFIAETPLVCFHFHAMKFSTSWLAYIGTAKINMPTGTLAIVYQPYIAELISVRKRLLKNNLKIDFKTSGIPWRYIAGRLMKGKAVKHFLWV